MGQDVSITPVPLPVDRFLTNIVGICQDSQGFIWLADNFKGLMRYDGSPLTYFRSDPYTANSLFTDNLECLAPGKMT